MESYEKITTLGQGGGGAVYLVRHQITKKLLALKKIQLDEKRKTRTRDAVEREARILSQLRHPHIVMYHDSFFQETPEAVFLCIAQDYCDGGNLDERIQTAKHRSTHFAEDRIMQWFTQLVMAVQFIHSKKILHRDLKTQNVFLTKSDVVKLGDFGISRTLEHTVDKAKTCVGTPCYLSPELCQDQPYNNKSDIWALGCLLYELCGFEPAFDAHNLISLYYKIVKGDNPTIPSMYSRELQELLDLILEKDPDKRPSSTTILSQGYMQQHLSNFIAEKELLQQQLATTGCGKPKSSTSPTDRSKVTARSSTKNRPLSASHSKRTSPHAPSHHGNLPPRSKSSLGMLPSMSRGGTGDTAQHSSALPPIARPHRPLEPSESGEYPDDFDSSDDEREAADQRWSSRPRRSDVGARPLVTEVGEEDGEVEVPEECEEASNSDDDIPEELEADDEPSERSTEMDRRIEEQEEEEEEEERDYPSDFEDDDVGEGALEVILSNARTATQLEPQGHYKDDSFEDSAADTSRLGASNRQLLTEECRDVLGDDIFSEIEVKIRENRGKDLDPHLLRLQFEEAIGSERMDTCYLLTELLSEVNSIEMAERGTLPVS